MKSIYRLTRFSQITIIQLFIILSVTGPVSAQTGDTTKSIAPSEKNEMGAIAQILVGQKQFDTIPSDKNKTKYSIDKDAKPFVFPTGESRVALFKLPEYVQPYTLTIASLCDCWGLKKKIFVPVGVFLDSGFRSSQMLLETDFKELDAGRSKPYRLETDILIDEKRKDYCYLLIYTQGEVTGLVQKTAVVDVGTPATGILPVFIKIKIRRAFSGDITLEVKGAK